MKIDKIYQDINLINNSGESVPNRKAEAEKVNDHGLEKERHSGTEVDFSNRSVEFSRAAEMMENVQADRVEKVNKIKTKIVDGTYSADSTKVAEKILNDVLANLVEP